MKLLYNLDEKNYPQDGVKIIRKAIRAIIYQDDKIALVKTRANEYKFPGGGQEKDETDIETLIREVKEETGLEVIPESITEYGLVREKRKSIFNEQESFFQDSYYYCCQVSDNKHQPQLDDYELEDGYDLVYVTPKEAYHNNIKLDDHYKWIKRDTLILKELMEK